MIQGLDHCALARKGCALEVVDLELAGVARDHGVDRPLELAETLGLPSHWRGTVAGNRVSGEPTHVFRGDVDHENP